MSKTNRYACQTPTDKCTGGMSVLSPSLKGMKTHASPEEAFNCYAAYLRRERGYTQIGPREFSPPDGGPVEVLTKKIRYGARLREGKEGTRFMAAIRNSGVIKG